MKTTIDDVIRYFGGRRPIAAELGIRPEAVSMWRQRGIPAGQAIKLSTLSGGHFSASQLIELEPMVERRA